MNKDVNSFPTTVHFWDCECEANYIHPKSVPVCPRCGVVSDERPTRAPTRCLPR